MKKKNVATAILAILMASSCAPIEEQEPEPVTAGRECRYSEDCDTGDPADGRMICTRAGVCVVGACTDPFCDRFFLGGRCLSVEGEGEDGTRPEGQCCTPTGTICCATSDTECLRGPTL